ncbi:MAG: hypothetical protein RI883_2566 [Bacteroidota bacterium]|jgi:hypothetical protein
MKKSNLILGSILILTLSVLTFIHFSNDHIECETVVKKYKNNDGDIVTRREHVCKEKYSL